jgi:hypothetical protein
MEHPFFSDINWKELYNKRETGKYVPDPPRYSTKDFDEEFKDTTLTPKQIDELFNGKAEESQLKDKIKNNNWVDDWDFVREIVTGKESVESKNYTISNNFEIFQ